MQNIPLVDLKAQYSTIKADIDLALKNILEQTAFIGGSALSQFEQNFAKACNRRYCVGLSSGTSAVKLALQAAGVGLGDEVITTPHTFIATAEAISELGATPVFVDILEDTMTIDPVLVQKAITPKTKAIVPVHLYGQSADLKQIMSIAQKHSLVVVEDAAQSHLAAHEGTIIPYGGIGAFSFYPGKNLGAYGDAGAVVTDDAAIAETVRKLANHGRAKGQKYMHELIGFNHRMDGLQAAVLNVKLKHLETWTQKRIHLAGMYDQLLQGIPQVLSPRVQASNRHVYHLYVIQAEQRDVLLEHLHTNGIEAGIHYPIPLHLQPPYHHLGYEKGTFPVAERVADNILSLPLYPELNPAQVEFIVNSIREFYGKK